MRTTSPVFRSRRRKPKTVVQGGGGNCVLGLLGRRCGRWGTLWRTGLERPLCASALEGAEPETEVGELSLESEALCLGGQSFVLSELASLSLHAIEELADEYLQERLLIASLVGEGHGSRQPRIRGQISPAVPPGG
jgi:hypothetical protein